MIAIEWIILLSTVPYSHFRYQFPVRKILETVFVSAKCL